MLAKLLNKIPVRGFAKTFLTAIQIQIPLQRVLQDVEEVLIVAGVEKWSAMLGGMMVCSAIAYASTELVMTISDQAINGLSNLVNKRIVNNHLENKPGVREEIVEDMVQSQDIPLTTLNLDPQDNNVDIETSLESTIAQENNNIIATANDQPLEINLNISEESKPILPKDSSPMEIANTKVNNKRKHDNDQDDTHAKRLKSNNNRNSDEYRKIVRPEHRSTDIENLNLLRSKTQLNIVLHYNPETGQAESKNASRVI